MKSAMFQVARPASPARNAAKTALQTAVFWTVFLYLIPEAITRLESLLSISPFQIPAQQGVSVAGFLAASALGLWSGFTMALSGQGTPLPTEACRRLVISGPYRYVRNPMAVAGLAQGFFVGWGRGSWGVLAYVAAGFFAWNYFVRPVEESELRDRFGDSYDGYRKKVRCWFPRIP